MEAQAKVKQPEYKARIEVPAWINTDKNGKKYISIKLFNQTVNLFKNEPKPEFKDASEL